MRLSPCEYKKRPDRNATYCNATTLAWKTVYIHTLSPYQCSKKPKKNAARNCFSNVGTCGSGGELGFVSQDFLNGRKMNKMNETKEVDDLQFRLAQFCKPGYFSPLLSVHPHLWQQRPSNAKPMMHVRPATPRRSHAFKILIQQMDAQSRLPVKISSPQL